MRAEWLSEMRNKYGGAKHATPGYGHGYGALDGPTAHPYDGRLGSPYEAYAGSSPSLQPPTRAPHHAYACSAYPSPYPPPTPPYRPSSSSPFKGGAVGYWAPPTYGQREREVGGALGRYPHSVGAPSSRASPRMGFATGYDPSARSSRSGSRSGSFHSSAVRSPSDPSLASPRRLPGGLADGGADEDGGVRSYETIAESFGRSPPREPPSSVRGWPRGVLTVVVKKAVGLPAGGWSARGEPSVVMTLGKLEKRTSTSRGMEPTWNEECEFVTTFDEVLDRGRTLTLTLILILARTLARTLA